jgi:glucokinase
VAAFERAARALAAGIYSIAAANDLAHAVIGGGVSRAADLLFPPLRAAYAEYARLDFVRDLTVGVAELGGDAGLYGAAGLLLDPKRYSATA